jgi:aryl-alcohol dehydrogenase-like predicted oxidoreductase
MRFRKLGSSDLEVSEIALGSWLTYAGGVEADATRACTEAAFEAGINFFDTANYVDLYQAHRFDPKVPVEETIEALQKVVTDGKARYLGFSEWTKEQIEAALEIAGPDLFVSSQPQYSMLWQAPEAEVFPLSAANGISQIVWSPLAEGVLTGKYRAGEAPPADSRAANESMNKYIDEKMSDASLEAVQRLRPIAHDEGLTMVELALAWVLRRDEVAAAIVGASRPEQVHANAKASGVELSADAVAAIDEALGEVPVKEPTLAPLAESGVLHR